MDEQQLTSLTNTQSTTAMTLHTSAESYGMHPICDDFGRCLLGIITAIV